MVANISAQGGFFRRAFLPGDLWVSVAVGSDPLLLAELREVKRCFVSFSLEAFPLEFSIYDPISYNLHGNPT